MSLLPVEFLNGQARATVIHVEGSMAVAEQRYGMFAGAYLSYVNDIARNAGHLSPGRTYTFPNGDSMRVVSHGDTDHVTIIVSDVRKPNPKMIEGFLVTPMNEGGTGGNTKAQVLYNFDFDRTGFSNSTVADMFAGNRRKFDGVTKYFSFDGTGGGDMAHEPYPKVTSTSVHLQNPNAYAEPYAALSGSIYCDGTSYPVLNGTIYGMCVSENMIILADFPGTKTARFHWAYIIRVTDSNEVVSIEYQGVLGSATVTGVAPANFSADMTSCIIGDTIVSMAKPFGADRIFSTTKIPTASSETVVRSGYKGNVINFTLKSSEQIGSLSNFSPHNGSEYGLPDNNPGPIDTHGHVSYIDNYFELQNRTGWEAKTPAWTARLIKDNHSIIIKEPRIVFQGLYPTMVYAWLRTVSIETINDSNELYWYKDYDTGDYVRCAWTIGYVSTTQYEIYGAPEPFESGVVTGRALNVGGNVVETGPSSGNWFYTVSNGKGDYVLRKAPNGHASDALLVSKTGAVRRIHNTYSVGII